VPGDGAGLDPAGALDRRDDRRVVNRRERGPGYFGKLSSWQHDVCKSRWMTRWTWKYDRAVIGVLPIPYQPVRETIILLMFVARSRWGASGLTIM